MNDKTGEIRNMTAEDAAKLNHQHDLMYPGPKFKGGTGKWVPLTDVEARIVGPMSRAERRKSKRLADDGKIVESGWAALRHLLGPQTPEIQVSEMRKAYFFGAQHLFASMMSVLDDGAEPTEQDLRRLDLIDKELKAFIDEMRTQ